MRAIASVARDPALQMCTGTVVRSCTLKMATLGWSLQRTIYIFGRYHP